MYWRILKILGDGILLLFVSYQILDPSADNSIGADPTGCSYHEQ